MAAESPPPLPPPRPQSVPYASRSHTEDARWSPSRVIPAIVWMILMIVVTHLALAVVTPHVERVLADFKTFVARVRATQPKIPIAFSSLTPGPGRWDEADRRKQTNKLLKDYIATQKNLHFIDLWDAMLTSDGQPREDIWVEDRVHPNHAGYLLRVKIMRPLLGAPDKR